jgi:predicted  nucleic acid-binding Zn-ribbon protein
VSGEVGPARADDNPLGLLLVVQDLDTAIAQHEHRKGTLPERREMQALGERAALSNRQVAELTRRHDELAGRLSHLEQQNRAVVDRRKTLEDRLYGARGAAGRDLQAIEAEVAQLAARLGQLEDEELVVMEEQEPIDVALAQHGHELAAMAEESRRLQARVAELDAEIDAELAELRVRRGEQAARLPESLARRYEDLRRRLGGTGAARLVGDRCGGCHLTLPAMEVDRIRHLPPDAVVTCEQCGRILVRASLAED